jgi:hypothetical protein
MEAAAYYDKYQENTELKAEELFGHLLTNIK